MTRFGLIGVGYIAERHLQAMREFGECVVACDVRDSVGILDKYAPGCRFHLDERDFFNDLHDVDYVSVCTPNDLHFHHCLQGMAHGCRVICEKPVCLLGDTIAYLDGVMPILQMRLHPNAELLKPGVVSVEYIAPRGDWYSKSWKGDVRRSGGICMNIGIHLFDLLIWKYGPVKYHAFYHSHESCTGGLVFQDAAVKVFLSTQGRASRKFIVNGEVVDFSHGFEDLHIESYRRILSGEGWDVQSCKPAIDLVNSIAGEHVPIIKQARCS